MTHGGLFQPRPFCDSVVQDVAGGLGSSLVCLKTEEENFGYFGTSALFCKVSFLWGSSILLQQHPCSSKSVLSSRAKTESHS